MKFSIVVPVYNVSDYLEDCLNSVLRQTFTDYELVVVNDGSTDISGQIADSFLKKNDHIKVIHQENGGASKARNNGVEYTTGDYILFLDGDDFWSDNSFLQKLDEELENNNVDVVIYGYSYYNLNGDVKNVCFQKESDIVKAGRLGVFNGPNWNKCVSKKLFKNGLRFPEDMLAEDSFYCSEVLKRLSSFSILQTEQYMYRQSRVGSLTNVVKERNVLDILKSIDIGLHNEQSLNVTIQSVLNTYFTISYISILPYVLPYKSNPEIDKLLKEYKYLLQYSKDLDDKKFKYTGVFTSLFGLSFSTRFFSYLLRYYK